MRNFCSAISSDLPIILSFQYHEFVLLSDVDYIAEYLMTWLRPYFVSTEAVSAENLVAEQTDTQTSASPLHEGAVASMGTEVGWGSFKSLSPLHVKFNLCWWIHILKAFSRLTYLLVFPVC